MSLVLYNNHHFEKIIRRSQSPRAILNSENGDKKPLLIAYRHSRKLITWTNGEGLSQTNSPLNSRRLLIEYVPIKRDSPVVSGVKRSSSGRITSGRLRGAVVIATPLKEPCKRSVIENPFITEEDYLIDNYLTMTELDWQNYLLGMGPYDNILNWYNTIDQNMFYSKGRPSLNTALREGFIREKPITNPFIGKFTIYFPKHLVAQTNNSNVYKCSSLGDDEWYALKVMAVHQPDELEMARKEIDFLAKCRDCSYIIKMIDYEINEVRGEARIVMEWGEQNIEEYVIEMVQNRWTTLDISLLMTEMVRAVKELHDRNIVHNDIKEANFLKVKGKVKLTDLGACHELPPHHPYIVDDEVMGTDGYYAPERLHFIQYQYQKIFKYDFKSDVYSLGCVFVKVLTGKLPFKLNHKVCGHCEHIHQLAEHLTYFQSGGEGREGIIFRRKYCKIDDNWKRIILRTLAEDPIERISLDEMSDFFQ